MTKLRRTIVRSAAVLTCLLTLSCTTETANGQDSGDASEPAREAVFVPSTEAGLYMLDTSQRVTEQAIAKAEELGYDLAKMRVTIELTEEGGWQVAFRPNSKVQSGGDMTAEFDNNGELTDVKRWR